MVRDRTLRRYSVPVVTGTVEVVGKDNAVRHRTGPPADFYMMRYGQWLDIGGTPFFITKTTVDPCFKIQNRIVGKATVEFINVPLSVGEV